MLDPLSGIGRAFPWALCNCMRAISRSPFRSFLDLWGPSWNFGQFREASRTCGDLGGLQEPLGTFREPSGTFGEPSGNLRGTFGDLRGPSGNLRGPSGTFGEPSGTFGGTFGDLRGNIQWPRLDLKFRFRQKWSARSSRLVKSTSFDEIKPMRWVWTQNGRLGTQNLID